jgi:hypothetical protein
MKKLNFPRLFCLACALVGVASVHAQQSPIPLFQSKNILDVEFLADFAQAKKIDPNNYKVGDLKLRGSIAYALDAEKFTHEATFQPRGRSRLKLCDFKIYLIKLKGVLTHSIFNQSSPIIPYNSHCYEKGGEDRSQESATTNQRIIAESVLYDIFEIFGLKTTKTRLIRAKYYDPQKQLFSYGIGMFVEDRDDWAKRHGGILAQSESVFTKLDQVPMDNLIRLWLAEIFALNMDFVINETQLENLRSIELDKGVVEISPFDLDLSKLVKRSNLIEPSEEISTYKTRILDYVQRVAKEEPIEIHADGSMSGPGSYNRTTVERKNKDEFQTELFKIMEEIASKRDSIIELIENSSLTDSRKEIFKQAVGSFSTVLLTLRSEQTLHSDLPPPKR